MGRAKSGKSTPTGVKRRKGRSTSEPLVFNAESRWDYVTGFEKRRRERRLKGKEDIKAREKAEVSKARQAYRERVKEQHAHLRASARHEQDLCEQQGMDDLVDAHQRVIDLSRKLGNERAKPLKRVSSVRSDFYSKQNSNANMGDVNGEARSEPPTANVLIDVTYGIPNYIKDDMDRPRPPRPLSDKDKPIVNQKKQNITPKKFTKYKKRTLSKREKANPNKSARARAKQRGGG